MDNTARLWDAATGKVIRAFTGHEGAVRRNPRRQLRLGQRSGA
jgi:WD40 repeat protein